MAHKKKGTGSLRGTREVRVRHERKHWMQVHVSVHPRGADSRRLWRAGEQVVDINSRGVDA